MDVTAYSSVSDLVEALRRLGAGDLGPEEVDSLFQALVETELIHYLEDSYQRTARDLVEAGRVILPREQEG